MKSLIIVSNLANWLKPPKNLQSCYLLVLPIILTQLMQRLYPVVDSWFISHLGEKALLAYSIQYNFIVFGQFIGIATGISCLIFWRRKDCIGKQRSILIKHLCLAIISTGFLAIILASFAQPILLHYNIEPKDFPLLKIVLFIGIFNMMLQAMYGGLDGMLIASGQQKKAMHLSGFLLVGNIFADMYAYHLHTADNSFICISISSTILLLISCILATYLIIKNAHTGQTVSFKEIFPVWQSEIGIYIIRGLTPLFYALQLAYVKSSSPFLTTYQLTLQLAYILCIPLIAGLQLAIRNASESAEALSESYPPSWWNEILYTGLLPTVLLLIIGMASTNKMFYLFFHYRPSPDQAIFPIIYFFACLIGQFANVLSIPIRSRKKSYFLTRNFFISEFIIMIGGTQLLIFTNEATPLTIGLAITAFVIIQLLLNLRSSIILNNKQEIPLTHEIISQQVK